MTTNEPMGIKELAEYLGLSAGHVRDMARGGFIPSYCIIRPLGCRKWRFKRKEIEEWAQASQRMPRPAEKGV